MLRMAHRILTTTTFTPTFCQKNCDYMKVYEFIEREIASATVVEASNVAAYYAENDDKNWEFNDFAMAMTPFDSMLIEFILDGWQYACLASSFDRTEDSGEKRREVILHWMIFSEGQMWLIGFTVQVGFTDRTITSILCRGYGHDQLTQSEMSSYIATMPQLFHVPMLTLAFMNCKNVTSVDATEELGPSAKWIRRQKAPTIRYHVLDINPMKEVLRTEGGIETNGLKKALHICRGHFAHYENGLFGRGEPCTVWKPSHVRGQAEQGIVLKDYRVKTGN